LELIVEGRILPKKLIDPLLGEATEIVAIMTQSQKTAKRSARKTSKEG